MNNIQASAILQKELSDYSVEFEDDLKSKFELDYTTSLKDYEIRINNALDLQYKATYLVSILSRMLYINREKIQQGGCDILKFKKDNDKLQFWLDYYKSHVFTFTSRSKTLSDWCKTKQISNPEIFRGD